MNKLVHYTVGIGLILCHAYAGAQQPSVVVDGNVWMNASTETKKAFLAGANSMIALEMAYARKKGTTPSVAATTFHAATEKITLDEMSNRITSWYENNPNRRELPVLGAAWIDMVSPSTGKPAQ